MISNGPWVKEIIRRRLDLPTLDIPFAIDKRIYKPIPSITRRKDLLLYFSRPDMPRRCYDLGIAALRMIQEKMGDAVEIAFFGSKYSPGTEGLRYTQLGILKHEDLAKLYNTATAAVVFSPTNPSMAPYEMISSGLPIIDIDVELNDWNYGGKDNVFLCQVEASDIATTAVRVMQDEQLRNETIARAQKFVAEKFLDEEGCVSCLIKIFDKAIRVSETEGHKDLSGGLDMYDAR
jgi:glycosyltransferase involved in cell wall biosynthesis